MNNWCIFGISHIFLLVILIFKGLTARRLYKSFGVKGLMGIVQDCTVFNCRVNLGTRRGGWSAPRPGRFTPGKDPVPIEQEAGWAPGTVWACAKNLVPTGIRSPDRPTRSQSLYRLSYPVPHIITARTAERRGN
jgi:hypothetical protein